MSETNERTIHCRIVEIPDGVTRETDYSFAKEVLEMRRNHKPPITYEQMKADLEREVVLYALEQLRNQGIIDQIMYENAVAIALRKLKSTVHTEENQK